MLTGTTEKTTAVSPEEQGIIRQLLSGDMSAFTYIVDAYQRPVFNLCYRMLMNYEDAEDAAQETFLRAYKSIQRFDPERSFGTWLLSIAAHYCIDQIRKRRMVLISLDDSPYFEVPDENPGPEKLMARKEDEHAVQSLLEKISAVDRAAVIMAYWYELSYEEIALNLSLTVSAVKSRLHRARKEMALVALEKQGSPRVMERIRYESPTS